MSDGEREAGTATFSWDGRNDAGSLVPNGVYFISMSSPSGMTSRRVIVLKR